MSPFSILICYSCALVLFASNGENLIQGIILSGSIFIIGLLLDELSTYLFIKRHGIEEFYKREKNLFLKQAIRKYGMKKGFLISNIYPKRILLTSKAILPFSLSAFVCGFILNYDPLLSALLALIFGLCFLGLVHLTVAISNFFTTYWI